MTLSGHRRIAAAALGLPLVTIVAGLSAAPVAAAETAITVQDPVTEGSATCTTGSGRPLIGTTTPTLAVTAGDNAVRADFEVTSLDGALVQSVTTGAKATTVVSAGLLTSGSSYRWRARAADAAGDGAWHDWCEFTVRTDLPIVADAGVNPPLPADLRDAVGLYQQLAEANPEEFGYPHVEDGQVVVDVLTAAAARKAEALEDGTLKDSTAKPAAKEDAEEKAEDAAVAGQRAVADRDADTRLVSTGSVGDTEQLKHDILTASDTSPVLDDAGVWRTEVDRETGRVAVTMETITGPAVQALQQRYGDDVEFVQASDPQLSTLSSRTDDTSPFSGGAKTYLDKGGFCSTAFAWSMGSTSGMLTAGHCAPAGDFFFSGGQSLGYVSSGTRENYTNGIGTVKLTGQSTVYGDMALIQVWDGRSSRAKIYRGGPSSSTSYPVRSMWHRRAQSGDQFCTGGVVSGELCGWTVDKVGADVKTNMGINHNQVTSKGKQGWCQKQGDSGGPVYTVNSDGSVAAKGMISSGGGGGSDGYGGYFDQCTMQFTDIYDAYFGFPGVLKVQ